MAISDGAIKLYEIRLTDSPLPRDRESGRDQ